MNDSRERFEACMRSCGEPTWRRADTDEYTNRAVRSAWLAWQEAERQMIERCAKVCEDYNDAVDRQNGPDGYSCAAAIRALGAATQHHDNDGTQHDFCHWTFDDNEFAPVWNGSCGAAWSFIDGGPEENKLRHCPECGKRCVVAKPRYDNDGTPLPERAEG